VCSHNAMGWILERAWLIMLACAGLFAIASPVQAAGAQDTVNTRCSTVAPSDVALDEWLVNSAKWTCPADSSDLSSGRQVLRFDLSGRSDGQGPTFFISRTAMFDNLMLITRETSGHWTSVSYQFNELQPTLFDRQFYAELPQTATAPETTYVVFDHPTQQALLDFGHLSAELPGASEADRNMLILLALVVGMIIMPLFFDAAFYRILRKPFILWHALFVCGMLIHLVTANGLPSLFWNIGLYPARILMVGSFGLIIVAALQFAINFVEQDALSDGQRRLVHCVSFAMALATIVHFAGIIALGSFPANLFYFTGAATGIAYFYVSIAAIKAGSKAIWFPVIAFSPLILVAGFRVVTFATPNMPTTELGTLFVLAAMFEVVVTALGVASRFMLLKRDRDRAQSDAAMQERLAGLDPLTGLMNRRAIEPSFATLYRDGFRSFALLDLDNFKSLNDDFGHSKGDEVLCAVALALAPDDDTHAIRVGGEEFLLLLRGENARDRVEVRRRAITARVAANVCGIDRLVTASAGFVALPQSGGERFSFEATYSHVDRLLYEAKRAGKNRLVAERMTVFDPANPPDRRHEPRPAAA